MSLPVLRRNARTLPALILFASLAAIPSHSQDVLTYHDNNARTGLDNLEKTLTLANVNFANFGKLFTVPADGLVDAEPLYISNVSVAGVTHNLLIVATEHDSVYAYDADTGVKIWHISTIGAGETSSDNHHCQLLSPEIGISATPVIARPKVGNPVIFVVAMTKDSSGNYHQRLHALDATTGAEVFHGPAEISAQYPGTGDNSSGGFVIFDPGQYDERASLLLVNNIVYLSWASHCDVRPYTAWIMGYNAATLKQATVLNLTPNGSQGGLWGSAAGMAADSSGSIILLDGNGTFDTTLTASGFPSEGDYGNAFLRLTTKGGLAVGDYFEMHNQSTENADDTDLGSGAALLITQKDSTGKIWNLAVGAGKDANIYIVDTTNMGKFNPTANHIYQQVTSVLRDGMWSMPAALNNSLYFGAKNAPIQEFQFNNAKLHPTATAKTSTTFAYPGATPSISANAGQNAIVWAAENVNPAVLHAYNAKTLIEIYNSNQAANDRDQFGAGNKYITPMIANGKVYVGTTTGVGVFGLLPPGK